MADYRHLHRFPSDPEEVADMFCTCGRHHPRSVYRCTAPDCGFLLTLPVGVEVTVVVTDG